MPTQARFIDKFDVILLDLMDTLMFGGNRFSDEQNYAATYRQLGGAAYTDAQIQQLIRHTYSTMNAHYGDPAYFESFRPASTYLAESLNAYNLPHTDAARLHNVFAHHEHGYIPEDHCRALYALAQTHRLGLVSNLWSEKPLFEATFRQCRIYDLFDTLVFSSDHHIIKPSPKLFQTALASFDTPPHRVLFVGDSPDRDMAGAAAVGMQTVLVTANNQSDYTGHQVRDVCNLLTLYAL